MGQNNIKRYTCPEWEFNQRLEKLEQRVKTLEFSSGSILMPSKIEPKFEEYYKVGQHFTRESKDEHYLLAQTGECEFNLIGLKGGNRFTNPLNLDHTVYHCSKIPKTLFDEHFGDREDWFLVQS